MAKKIAFQRGSMVCPDCNGNGWYSDHDRTDMRPEHYNDGDCQICPVQVQCENCRGTGFIK